MPVANNQHKTAIKIKPLHLDYIGARELYFPAIVTEFKDSFEPKWKEEEVYGRMDPIGLYGGTKRKIALGFRIISESIEQGQVNMGYLSSLIQYLYPKYKELGEGGANTNSPSLLQNPPFVEVRFMNVIASSLTPNIGLRGFFTSFTHTTPFGNEDNMQIFDNVGRKPSEVNSAPTLEEQLQNIRQELKDERTGSGDRIYFSDVQVNFTMTVLHERNIGWYSGYGESKGAGGIYPYNTPENAKLGDALDEAMDANPSARAAALVLGGSEQ